MRRNPTSLIDAAGIKIATLDVRLRDGHYEGTLSFLSASGPLMPVFAEYEEIVEGQALGLLDAIEDRIDALALRVLFDTGEVVGVSGLQVYPGTNAICFPAPALAPIPGLRTEGVPAAPAHHGP